MKKTYTWHTNLDILTFFCRLQSRTHRDTLWERFTNENGVYLRRQSQLHFWLVSHHAYVRNSFRRRLSARVIPTATGLEITGRFVLHPLMTVFNTIWLVGVGYGFCVFLLANTIFCLIPLGMAGVFVALLLLARGKPEPVLALMDKICGHSHVQN